MRQQPYKFQPRPHKLDRQQPSPRHPDPPKGGFTPGSWKSYIPHEISLSSQKRNSRTPSNHSHSNRNGEANYDGRMEQDSRITSILSSRKEEERRRQESAMRKVRELQEKVLPLVRGREGREEEEGVWIGWQAKVEQKLMRLEGQVENMKKEMELVLERRVVEVEGKWEARFAEYLRTEDKA